MNHLQFVRPDLSAQMNPQWPMEPTSRSAYAVDFIPRGSSKSSLIKANPARPVSEPPCKHLVPQTPTCLHDFEVFPYGNKNSICLKLSPCTSDFP